MFEALIAPLTFLIVWGGIYVFHGRYQEPTRRRQIVRTGAIAFVAFVVGGALVRLVA